MPPDRFVIFFEFFQSSIINSLAFIFDCSIRGSNRGFRCIVLFREVRELHKIYFSNLCMIEKIAFKLQEN